MTLYRKIGDDNMVSDVVAKPNIREGVRAIFAQYKADELITKRKEVSEKITAYLTDQFKEFGLTVADVNVSDVNFSASFDQAVEGKVKAEQDALAQKNELEKVKYQAQQTIERAKAEAETIRIQSAAIKENG
jgi:regulator of protease activity HflC (stomatin/prohibitin superfamily)